MIARTLALLMAVGALSGCGDDLESRQAAVEQQRPNGGQVVVGQRDTAPERTPSAPSPTAPARGFADTGETLVPGESAPLDSDIEGFVDEAQGFSTDPIDDTSGFDPTPSDAGGFAPEPLAPESFED